MPVRLTNAVRSIQTGWSNASVNGGTA
ncbi:hypothetical protein MTBUT4_70019 [Magnetospirillum sp. UT-4]|nr:hypothetical protein MTBUT4_70019 [Magnetospirillum sp. UT-4]